MSKKDTDTKNHYDFFVIGAGSGGVRAARMAAGHGARVGIAESWDMGGTCVNRGCVPKKLLVYSAKFKKAFEDAVAYGWRFWGWHRFRWPDLIRNKDKEIRRLNGIYNSLLDESGVTIHRGYAAFKDPHTLEIDGQTVTADKILIATGGKPRRPDIPGAAHMITSDDVFHLPHLPKKIVIFGGGYIAVEFAGIFKGLGCDVTLINRSKTILRGFDPDLQLALAEEMKRQGIKVVLNCEPERIEKRGGTLLVHTNHGETLAADTALAAIGRVPHTADLNLEAAGVETGRDGRIVTNEASQTSAPHIFAVGDVTNDHNLTPVALAEGHALADRLFGNMPDRKVSYDNIPTAVFSQPAIGTVGLTEDQVEERGIDYQVYKTAFRSLKDTMTGGEEHIRMKMIVERKTDRVLGIHLMGDDAPELIQLAGVVLNAGGTKADFDRTIGVHPTAAEELVTMRSAVTRPA